MKLALALVISLFIAGCASPVPMTEEQVQRFKAPICTTPSQCATAWQATQVWIINNSQLRIQMANDTVIQTYGAVDGSTYLAYTVTKEPVASGYMLRMRAACDNIFGCIPKTAQDAIIEYNTHIRTLLK